MGLSEMAFRVRGFALDPHFFAAATHGDSEDGT